MPFFFLFYSEITYIRMPGNRIFIGFNLKEIPDFREKLLQWAFGTYNRIAFLNSNSFNSDKHGEYESILAIGETQAIRINNNSTDAFNALKEFADSCNDWIFGFMSYDLKNQVEQLKSENYDGIRMPLMYFFRPEVLFILKKNSIEIGLPDKTDKNHEEIFNSIINTSKGIPLSQNVDIQPRLSKKEYIKNIEIIKEHIQLGDIYEMNYCFEFYAENAEICPITSYQKLNESSPAPFSVFFRLDDKYLLSSSPERYLKKNRKHIMSQPIKGTIHRGYSPEEDEKLKEQLFNDQKERSENVMIVDLVRNDLSRIAKKDSVKVEELYGIYSFAKVHQMISTVSCEMNDSVHFTDVIKATFPMGSMTGAPKIRAMELAEKYEITKRGLYSGAVGYITPEKDFDFNVVIRSVLYNEKSKYLSFMAGSAITARSEPEKEHKECLLKAKAMAAVFGQKILFD